MKKTLIFAALVAALCSCSSEQVTNPDSPQGDVKLDLNGSVGSVVISKAETDNLPAGTKVGVFTWQTEAKDATPVTDLGTTSIANKLYDVVGEGVFQGNPPIQLYSNRKYAACAYAPQKSTVKPGVDTRTIDFLHNDDVMFAPTTPVVITPAVTEPVENKAPATAKVTFGFKHLMSQVKLDLQTTEGAATLAGCTVKITGFFNGVSLDLKTGAITRTDTKTAFIEQPFQKANNDSGFDYVYAVPGDLSLSYLITAADGSIYKLDNQLKTFEAGKSYLISIKLTKGTIPMVVVGQVDKWAAVETVNIEVPSAN